MILDTDLIARIKFLESLKKDAELRSNGAPSGKLKVYDHHGKPQYWLRENSKGKYIPKSDVTLIAALAQKEYDEKLSQQLDTEIDVLKTLKELQVAEPWERALASLHTGKHEFVRMPVLSDEEYAAEWLVQSFEPKGFKGDSPFLFSERGERMRSKSEIMIADVLSSMGIPYLYERPLKLPHLGTIYPDFTLLDPHERREIIWEHFGLLDNDDYRGKMMSKLRAYNADGYFEGKNLIVTYETTAYPLDMKTIRQKAEAYLHSATKPVL